MIFHGTPYGIHITSDDFKSGDVNKLNNKRISQLRILACNCGHKDVKDNIAKKIKNRITKTKTIFAMDGSISYYKTGHNFNYKYYKPRLSTNQSAFTKFASTIYYRAPDNQMHSKKRSPVGLYKV